MKKLHWTDSEFDRTYFLYYTQLISHRFHSYHLPLSLSIVIAGPPGVGKHYIGPVGPVGWPTGPLSASFDKKIVLLVGGLGSGPRLVFTHTLANLGPDRPMSLSPTSVRPLSVLWIYLEN